MGLLDNVIRTAVISVLGAKLAKGRSPIMAEGATPVTSAAAMSAGSLVRCLECCANIFRLRDLLVFILSISI
jgi:hypothetical protein